MLSTDNGDGTQISLFQCPEDFFIVSDLSAMAGTPGGCEVHRYVLATGVAAEVDGKVSIFFYS